MPANPWPHVPLTPENFARPPRAYGILPFWFLNGRLEPDEMRYQLKEFRAKGMPGIILHGRYGLAPEYLGETYLDRIQLSLEEAERLGLTTWIYDEMNWPSGTADKRVLKARPDLASRYLECLNFTVRGPWFTYLTGADSRYIDFEKSTPVAAFAVRLDGPDAGQVIDLTANLSFRDVIPWEAPAGNWRLLYIVEKLADYYIDAIDPEATREFLRLGYEPYWQVVKDRPAGQMLGFYTDEPAMFYYVSGGDHPIVPWSKDLFRRFQARNGYSLRPRLPDLFFDIGPDSARVRYDFYTTLTEFYSEAYYQQIHAWCQAHEVLFTGHILYEEWLRRMIRVEGNPFKHLAHLDVTGVDHLYPIIGDRDRPDEHVAMKVASSAAHQNGSPRLLCESFGGLFMDATLQRMKWVADWEYVLGVNLLNPHGFHYTLEGPRKRDWPPSMFYQYPWWPYYGAFSDYIARLSHLLSGGRHVAKAAVLWPINAMFATYMPQTHTALGDRTEHDTNALTDSLLRLHYDFDYLDEDVLAQAVLEANTLRVRDEAYELVILPPLAHIKLATLDKLERFVAAGGRVLGMVFLPAQAFAHGAGLAGGLVDIRQRVRALFGVDPQATLDTYPQALETELVEQDHPGGGQAAFLRTYALARRLPLRLQHAEGRPGWPESNHLVIEAGADGPRYFYAPAGGAREDVTEEVAAERQALLGALECALRGLVPPDVVIDNPEVFYLHRVKDGRDVYFLVNSTPAAQAATVTLTGEAQPYLWDPSTGTERPVAPVTTEGGTTRFEVTLPPVGSLFVVTAPEAGGEHIAASNVSVDSLSPERLTAHGRVNEARVRVQRNGQVETLTALAGPAPTQTALTLDGAWVFEPAGDNALVIDDFVVTQEQAGKEARTYAAPEADTSRWLPMHPGAWSYQLPGEPADPYPLAVWYRARFEAETVPAKLAVIVDGWAGSEWQLYVNGQPAAQPAVRSAFDAEMLAVDITAQARPGENVLAIRLVLTSSTDGLLDLLKLMGTFSVAEGGGRRRLAAPRATLEPCSWTRQGYPYYSGLASFRRRFELPADWHPGAAHRVFLEPRLFDDVVEVLVNGQCAGVRLWPPYGLEITDHLRPGQNELELRVANTLINLLEAVERPSGLAGPPEVVVENRFVIEREL